MYNLSFEKIVFLLVCHDLSQQRIARMPKLRAMIVDTLIQTQNGIMGLNSGKIKNLKDGWMRGRDQEERVTCTSLIVLWFEVTTWKSYLNKESPKSYTKKSNEFNFFLSTI